MQEQTNQHTTLNEAEFLESIELGDSSFSFKIIKFKAPQILLTKSTSFHNCIFIGDEMKFSSTQLVNELFFNDCRFLTKVNLNYIQLNIIALDNCFVLKDKSIRINCDLVELSFENKKKIIHKEQEGDIILNNCKIEGLFIQNFHSNQNIEIKNTEVINITSIENSSIESLNFTSFKSANGHTQILNSIISHLEIGTSNFSSLTLTGNLFNKSLINFLNSVFNQKFEFFANIDDKTSTVNIINCDFKSEFKFEANYVIKHLNLDSCNFSNHFSAQDNSLNSININRTSFLSTSSFDNITINEYQKCDRKTLRSIKQQLQKSENRIDYNKFRAFELNAFRKENDTSLNDKMILWINYTFSRYGNNWTRSLLLTILSGLFFYTILFIIKSYPQELNLLNYNKFLVGFFKYFLITNFHDPLSNSKEYINNAIEWIPFIIGKIIIAFGLYETIQSFRKYKK